MSVRAAISPETISPIANVVVPTDREMLREIKVAIAKPTSNAITPSDMPRAFENACTRSISA